MKVLFLTVAKIDSIEDRAIYPDLLRKFRNEGHTITVLTPLDRRLGKRSHMITEDGCRIIKVWTPGIQKANIVEKTIGTVMIQFLFKRAMERFLKNEHFDLILYSTPPITLNNLVASVKAKTHAKTYLLLKDIFPQNAVDLGMISQKGLIYRYFRNKERALYRISDHIGCMSELNKRYVLTHNPWLNEERVEVNPNSIYMEPEKDPAFDTVERLDFIPKDKIVFIYAGSLGKPQGLDFLLDVIADAKSNPKAFFLIVGNGSESVRIRNWFLSNRPDNAVMIDFLPQKAYSNVLKHCHVGLVFLDPNFTIPNYPSRILSYMENKLPIIFAVDKNTDVGIEAEAGQYGLNCENGDKQAFMRHVNLLTEDSDRRKIMGIRGYERLKKDFNVDHSYELIMNHF